MVNSNFKPQLNINHPNSKCTCFT
uniref:Uncharacterized protein n=1 Tax=Anguilla anguilla TaxID=7936 RepID=A0A0E9UJF2_ANGAN